MLLLVLGACGGSPQPPAPVQPTAPPLPPVASPPPPPPLLAPPAALLPRADASAGFCAALGRIVDAEPEGFLVLRGLGDGRWGGTAVPTGFADCWVEDLAARGPHYLCRAERFAAAPEALAADHLTLLAALDSCLARPTWFPLSWRRGQAPDAASPHGDGRRAAWRAGATGPAVALGLEPHPDRPLWWDLLVVGPSG